MSKTRVKWFDREVLREAETILEATGDKAIKLVESDAKRLVRKGATGKLGQSIKIQTKKGMFGEFKAWRVSAYGAPDRYYASFMELGLKKKKIKSELIVMLNLLNA